MRINQRNSVLYGLASQICFDAQDKTSTVFAHDLTELAKENTLASSAAHSVTDANVQKQGL